MATNGTLTPPNLHDASSSVSATKRKRSNSGTTIEVNGASAEVAVEAANTSEHGLQEVLQDILDVLKRYDTEPSILHHPISTSASRSHSGEPSIKRKKLVHHDDPPTVTVSNLIQDGSYDSLEQLAKDIESATSNITTSIKSKEVSLGHMLDLDDTRTFTGVFAFQKVLKNMMIRESQRKPHFSAGLTESMENSTHDSKAEVINSSNTFQEIAPADSQEGRTVLTLYGNAGAPKQLFSSLQQPARVTSSETCTAADRDTSVKITMPLRESSLPNIFSTTKIFPAHIDDLDSGKKYGPTFGELFAPPANIPQLSPPKPAKQLTTRGTTISFVPHGSLSKTNRKGPYMYPTQNLTTGQWLGYSGVDAPKEPSSPTVKQKNRQRALSTGEAQLPPSEATLTALKHAKEDALFRGAYSSFAPSRDDATAIVPEDTKNRVWWQKIGEKRFNDAFAIDPSLEVVQELFPAAETTPPLDEEDQFRDAVESFEPPDKDYALKLSAQQELDKDTEDILLEISELLETLASHQRIRNSSLATNPRTPVIQNASLASLAGSPSTPSSEEIDVYQMLKSQLSLMISSLPPYAVAKLNGDQLAELNISRTILVDTEDYRGVLEEDQVSRLAKQTALNAAAGPAPVPRMASHPHYPPTSNQFPRTTPVAHAPPPSRSSQTSQSYYTQQPALHRSPSVHYSRSTNGSAQQYQTPRTGYPPTQVYGQQTPRPSYSQNNSGQYYSQRSSQSNNYNVGSAQYYQSTPQTQTQTRYPQQGQGAYQQRPQNTSMYSYNSSQSPHMRTGSPLKTGQPPTQQGQSPYNASRASYGTTNAQMRGGGYFNQPTAQTTSQYGTPQPATPSALGPSGFHTSMSTEQQQMMMDRQRALAMQPQARMTAQSNVNGQGSGTPQPSNGQYGGQQQVNGTPMVA